MTDPVRLYEDYRRFWQRFKYYLRKQGHPAVEYIIAAEPQGRGAWHLHCLFLFSDAVNTGQFKATQLAKTKDKSKSVIKGARLNLYPPGFNLYRSSRGIKRPEVWQITEREAQAKISGIPLTYEKTICITDEWGNTRNIINYRTYTKGADTSCTESKDTASKKAGSTEGTPI